MPSPELEAATAHRYVEKGSSRFISVSSHPNFIDHHFGGSTGSTPWGCPGYFRGCIDTSRYHSPIGHGVDYSGGREKRGSWLSQCVPLASLLFLVFGVTFLACARPDNEQLAKKWDKDVMCLHL